MSNPLEYDEDMSAEENIARGLFAVAASIRSAGRDLGNGGAAAPMGAIEAFGVVMKEGLADVALNLASVADAVDGVRGSVDDK